MTIAGLLIAGALAAVPAAARPIPLLEMDGVPAPPRAAVEEQRRGQPQRPGQPPRTQPQRRGPTDTTQQGGDRPHQFGLGGTMVVSNRGASGGFRYWFGDRVGVNFTAGWYTNGGRNTTVNQGRSTAVVLPSVMVMLTKPNETRQIDVRPYVGAGVNYSRAYGPTQTGATTGLQRRSGTGAQAFAGAEVTFREMDMVTLSGEGIYYVLPTSYVNSPMATGFNYVFAVHFYLK